MEKKKLGIAMQVLLDVFVKFQDTRDFIDEKLEEKFASENISVEELTYFSLLFFFGNESLSLILKIALFSSTLIYGLLYNKKRCKITSLEWKNWYIKYFDQGLRVELVLFTKLFR